MMRAALAREMESRQRAQLGRELKARVTILLTEGFWFCNACEHTCERIEGEHGQPAHCKHCGSAKLEYYPPAYNAEPQL